MCLVAVYKLTGQAKSNDWSASAKAEIGQDKTNHNDKTDNVNDRIHGF